MGDTRSCIVCGQGSTRDDWINKAEVDGEEVVACDHHSKEEIAAKIMGLSTKEVEEAKPVEAPPTPATPPPVTAANPAPPTQGAIPPAAPAPASVKI